MTRRRQRLDRIRWNRNRRYWTPRRRARHAPSLALVRQMLGVPYETGMTMESLESTMRSLVYLETRVPMEALC